MLFCMVKNYFNLNPYIEKLFETLIYITAKTKNWNQLILISDKAYSNKIINKEILHENKSIAYYEIAKIKESSDLKEANRNIIKALEFKKNFQPFIKFHLELTAKLNNINLLKKMIKKVLVFKSKSFVKVNSNSNYT